MKYFKNIPKLQILFLILLSLFIYSCDSVEEDDYVTTELNGLYRYKSLYATKTCNADDDTYTENIEDEIIQPYFMLEGKKELGGTTDKVLLYYCEDRRFSTCDKEHEYLFAKGIDENWVFESVVTAKYDYAKKACVFTKNYVKENNFMSEKLELKTMFYSYEDKDLSSDKCRISNMDSSSLRCKRKKKYSMLRVLISDRDKKYFEEQAQKEEKQN